MTGYNYLLVATALAAFVQPASTAPTEIEAAATKESVPKSASTGSTNGTGLVEGIVRYQTDSKRQWPFSRYYVQNSRDGFLAEAVVAMEGSALAESAPADPPKTCTMDQVNFQFVPETMAIRVGDSVRVINSDDALHNVMTPDGGKPFNVSVAKGNEFAHTFDRAGGVKEPVRLSCAFHGGMRAWIYVFDHPWFKVTERDGRFRFENMPAGEYTLHVIHPAGRLRRSQRIEVKTNGTASLEIVLLPDDLIGMKEKAN
jgi:plastocyanin